MTANRSAAADLERDAVLIEVGGVRLAYGRQVILDDVCMEVRRGESWFFAGPNGTGKTTLLKAILGLLLPAAGTIRTHLGHDRIGFVPQRCDFHPTLRTTVREFVTLGLVGIKVDRGERRRRLSWALDRVGLARMQSHDYGSLSGGQRQAASVARALIRRPALLLADEPTSGLDLAAQHAFLNLLADLRRTERLTLVLVAHDLMLAARHCSHVALFHEGGVLAGPTSTVLVPENLRTTFQLPPDLCRRLSSSAIEQETTDGGAA
jgi:ABC-type Mn2+/Zn2+ transport system ATPase subunit